MKESQICGSLHLPIPSAAPRAAPFTKHISHAAAFPAHLAPKARAKKPTYKKKLKLRRRNPQVCSPQGAGWGPAPPALLTGPITFLNQQGLALKGQEWVMV